MNARAALRGVQAEAGLRLSVIGYLRPPVRFDRRIGIARGHHLDAARRQQRLQPPTKRESEGLFELIVGEASARIVAAVGRIQNHNESGRGGRRSRWGLR